MKIRRCKETLLEFRKNELSPKHILIADIIASVSYILNLNYGIGNTDDIDHLGNRRLRTVGELLQNQFTNRSCQNGENRQGKNDDSGHFEVTTPQALMNIRPVTAAIKEFFGSSQLSQFMDQNNPLAELTHKRRLSALGPGGLSRERAGFEGTRRPPFSLRKNVSDRDSGRSKHRSDRLPDNLRDRE